MEEWSTNASVHCNFAFIICLFMGLCTFEHVCVHVCVSLCILALIQHTKAWGCGCVHVCVFMFVCVFVGTIDWENFSVEIHSRDQL